MPEYPNSENNCETDGIISPLAGVMGTLQANEVLKADIESVDKEVSKEDAISDVMESGMPSELIEKLGSRLKVIGITWNNNIKQIGGNFN